MDARSSSLRTARRSAGTRQDKARCAYLSLSKFTVRTSPQRPPPRRRIPAHPGAHCTRLSAVDADLKHGFSSWKARETSAVDQCELVPEVARRSVSRLGWSFSHVDATGMHTEERATLFVLSLSLPRLSSTATLEGRDHGEAVR